MAKKATSLWTCPKCAERFTTANQWHSCGKFDLEAHFARCQPIVRALYDAFIGLVKKAGDVTIIPQKTRIAVQAKMRFAALMPQRSCLKGHLVLAEPTPAACFEKIETFSPRNHVHVFRLTALSQMDRTFRACVRAAYRVGRQEHLPK